MNEEPMGGRTPGVSDETLPHPLTRHWLNVADTAAALGLDVSTVKRLAPAELPFYRVVSRGDRRYRVVDVVRYLALRRVG